MLQHCFSKQALCRSDWTGPLERQNRPSITTRRSPSRRDDLSGCRATGCGIAGARDRTSGCLREREVEPTEVLLGELAARVVEQLDEGGSFRLKAPLQRALAHAELAGDLVAPWLAVGQPENDYFAGPVAGLGMVETSEVIAGEAIVQLGEHRV